MNAVIDRTMLRNWALGYLEGIKGSATADYYTGCECTLDALEAWLQRMERAEDEVKLAKTNNLHPIMESILNSVQRIR